jgi:DNA (cytosine-5)-methyltransferase 1
MNYLSVCSGIEAATVAWHPLGWTAQAYSEIEPFPCKVLAHHYPYVPNHGDMTKFKEWPDYANVDVLVGGTPCQSFSIAGLRKGLDDPRGNLMLTYLAIADKYRPTWLVWENVPGVLSSNGGKDFGTFLGGLGQLGYGFAYRVLDAQYVRTDGYPHAVPQRRRRVFVVGHIGSWQRAAAVLFDTESLRGNPPPRREAGKAVAGTISKCSFTGGASGRPEGAAGHHFLPVLGTDCYNGAITGDVSCTIGTSGSDTTASGQTVMQSICMSTGQAGAEIGIWIGIGIGTTLNCNHEAPIAFTARDYGNDAARGVTPTMRSLCKGADGHQSGAAGLAVAYPINTQIAMRHEALGEGTGMGIGADGDASYTLQAAHSHAVAYRTNAAGQVDAQDGISAALNTQTDPCAQIIHSSMQVRRLTPAECHSLQGFSRHYLHQVPGSSDTQMYKALGNSMAVNVMQLIGQRIQMVSEIPL